MIGPRTHSSGTRSAPKRKRSSWYSSRRFSVATLTAHWWWINGRRRWFSRTSASPTPAPQVDAVVEGAALAALVAPDVRLPDGLRPVDRVEERDGLVADGLEAGQGDLDELPLDDVDQGPGPSGGPCERFGERRRAGGGGRGAGTLARRPQLHPPPARAAALAGSAGR